MTHRRQESILRPIGALELDVLLPKLALERFSFADVSNRANHERSDTRAERAQADLDGKLGAILTTAVEIETRAHRANSWVARVIVAMFDVPLAQAIRHEQFDLRTDQLVKPIAEQLLRVTVGEGDAPASPDDDRCVGNRLHQLEPILGAPRELRGVA
ncbi:MAG: hypothetical protein ABI231_05085 [Candidatus Tumulicola sp.]